MPLPRLRRCGLPLRLQRRGAVGGAGRDAAVRLRQCVPLPRRASGLPLRRELTFDATGRRSASGRWYNVGLPRRHRSTVMSADRDRGIRRIKQKRAKAQKKDERQQRREGVVKRTAVTPTARRPA